MDHLNSTDSPPAEIVTPASEPAEQIRRKAQEYADHWWAMLRERPDWRPRRSHIEMAASELQRIANDASHIPARREQEPTADQSWQYARQIVCEEWQRAVKQYGLVPGSLVETVVSQIINRLDGDLYR